MDMCVFILYLSTRLGERLLISRLMFGEFKGAF